MSEISRRELIVVDGAVTNNETIIQALGDRDYLILSEHNGLDEVKAYLTAKDAQYDVIHFITHGSAGALSINGETITNDSFSASDWADIGSYLTDKGDLLFYGCEIAKTADGKRLVDSIAKAARADVAASIDLTGKHGDWELEYVSGLVESLAITVDGYDGNLTTEITKAQTLKTTTTVTDTSYHNISDHAVKLEHGEFYDDRNTFTFTTCSFKENYQGIYAEEYVDIEINGTSVKFSSNADTKDGAGIYTESYYKTSYSASGTAIKGTDERTLMTISADSALFECNVAGNTYAINFKGKDDDWKEWKNHAAEHSSEKYGGAIYGYLNDESENQTIDNNKDNLAKQFINNVSFKNNAAIAGGGAVAGDGFMWYVFDGGYNGEDGIANYFQWNGAGYNSYITIAAHFQGQNPETIKYEKGQGGAVFLNSSSWAEFNSKVQFNNNYADIAGGAIAAGVPHAHYDIKKILEDILKLVVDVAKLFVPGGKAADEAKMIKKVVKCVSKLTKTAKVALDVVNNAQDFVADNGNGTASIHSEILVHEDATFSSNTVLGNGGKGGAVYLDEHAIASFEKTLRLPRQKAPVLAIKRLTAAPSI